MSSNSLYLAAAEELRENARQWEVFESTGHCVVLAGPGSGKTKTLTLKMAKILAEDTPSSRGIACITYNNECARELESRLTKLGVEHGRRVFIGTVHSFSLTQIILPYAKAAGMDLPDGFRVASTSEADEIFASVYSTAGAVGLNPFDARQAVDDLRRSVIDRESDAWKAANAKIRGLAERYESRLRKDGLIDFEDMPIFALRALQEHDWLCKAMLAKYPTLVVDEYQDLGRVLHSMVMRLCFKSGVRLLAVGDIDQSIYGFTGAVPAVLRKLSEREGVQTVTLDINYRSGKKIVEAAQHALGEARGYRPRKDAEEGVVFVHPCSGSYSDQAKNLITKLLPEAMKRVGTESIGDVAILYPDANLGDELAAAARAASLDFIRADKKALYPRGSRLIRWLEDCAKWCVGGWKTGQPRFSKLFSDGRRLFAEALPTEAAVREFNLCLAKNMWSLRDPDIPLKSWLITVRDNLVVDAVKASRALTEDAKNLEKLIELTEKGKAAAGFTLATFSGDDAKRLNLSTMHSSKGREFEIVFLFGMDQGKIPWNNIPDDRVRESRRLFYVGFTRAKREVHIVHSAGLPSQFVTALQQSAEL